MLGGLMTIGESALSAAQAWISVTGNNIANANTEGYTRRYVDQRDAGGIQKRCGQEGLGTNAQQVLRYFDQFLEGSYVDQLTNSSRWNEFNDVLASVESLFNESNVNGISSELNEFFKAWNDLALRPDDVASREDLLAHAETLADLVNNTMSSIRRIQNEMNVSIQENVDHINDIAVAIADLNRQIGLTTVDGVSNPNTLLDQRDQYVRELAGMLDVEVIDGGRGDFRVQLTTGQPLVDGDVYFSLAFENARAENHLMPQSTYAGEVLFEGQDEFEYTVEIVTGGSAGDGTPASGAQFRVSIDGGKTWLKDMDGKEIHYDIQDKDGNGEVDPVLVKDITVSFTSTDDFSVGDRFNIIPKKALYWVEPTRGPENITPQIDLNGNANPDRVTGGTLTAYFAIRDDNCGRYIDELDAFTSSLIWEVNRIHSQGTGLQLLTNVTGDQQVQDVTQALGTPTAVTPYYNRLTEGNLTLHFFDTVTGGYLQASELDFTPYGSANGNFDPKVNSLEDVRDALNDLQVTLADGTQVPALTAEIQDGRLLIKSNTDDKIAFATGNDSTGLWGALGINTFFSGDDAASFAVNSTVRRNANLVVSGQVDGQDQINEGDNKMANAIANLSSKDVTITTFWKTKSNQSLSEFYATLVTTVGSDKRMAATNATYHQTLTDDLWERVQSVTGVSMDEEMANLIQFQHNYTAASKLITTADQMLQTILGLKQ